MRLYAWVPLLVAASATAARADSPGGHPVRIAWEAPDGCPDEASVTADVQRQVGHSLVSADVTAVKASAAQTGAGFSLHVETTGTEGTRVRDLDGATCEAVARAAALMIAMEIDPDAASGVPPPAPLPKPSALEKPKPPPSEPAKPTSKPTTNFRARAAGGVDLGSLPQVAPEISLSLAFLYGHLRVEGYGAYLGGPRVLFPNGAGASFALALGGVHACATTWPGRLEIAGCAGAEAGALFGSSFGVPQPLSGAEPWVAPALTFLGTYRFAGPFGVGLQIDGMVPIFRAPFTLSTAPGTTTTLFRPPPVSARAALGLEAGFP